MVKKAFKKNAALRETKVRLEKQLEKAREKLMAVKDVDKILANPKYSSLGPLKDKAFLKGLEAEVAEEHKKAKRKSARNKKDGKATTRTRLSIGEKQTILKEVLGGNLESRKATELADELKAKGIKGQPLAFLQGCDLPAEALVKGKTRRDGWTFHPKKARFLLQRLEEAGVVKKEKAKSK